MVRIDVTGIVVPTVVVCHGKTVVEVDVYHGIFVVAEVYHIVVAVIYTVVVDIGGR